tara:strand:- start:199 stop:465 length:267 start_codon:yes stop_codon:yes gene_type:complete
MEEGDDILWGDTPADIMINALTEPMLEAFVKCNEAFQDYVGRPMTPREFLGGVAFHMRAVEYSMELASMFGAPQPYTLDVTVIEVEEH